MSEFDQLAPVTRLFGHGRRPRRTRRQLAVRTAAGVAGLALVVTAVTVVMQGSSDPSPGEELAAIRGFLHEASTARFTARLDIAAQPVDPADPGFRERVRAEGEMVLEGPSRWLLTAGPRRIEAIFRPEGFYRRSADENGFLSGELWGLTATGQGTRRVVPPDGFSAEFLGSFSDASSALGLVQPRELRRVVERLRDPERVRPGVIRGTVSLSELAEADRLTGHVVVELTSGRGGRLKEVTWKVATDGGGLKRTHEGFPLSGHVHLSATSEIAFSDWDDEHLVVAQPPESKIDYLPDPIVVDDLLAYTDTPLVGPRDLPAGWRLQVGWVGAWREDPNGEGSGLRPLPRGLERPSDGCRSVLLIYRDPNRHREWRAGGSIGSVPPELKLILSPSTCVQGSGLRNPESYRAGVYFGRIERPSPGDVDSLVAGETPVISAEVGVGTTLVEATARLPEAEFTRVLASLAPLSLVPA